tara:strand:+ start:3207 stop:3941 length:735 start_codon:yes stop_codon:yes gene_type:complete
MEAILKRLENDKDYYGDFGKKFLSNSDIYTLLNNPRAFRQQTVETKPLIEGRYFHTYMLEPDKIDTFKISGARSRNSTEYKKDLHDYNENILILRHEVDHLNSLCGVMKANFKFFDDIYANVNKYEVPGITFLKGEQWKGKADILCEDKIIDLKTTADISKFHISAKKYNYDSQAYIYQQIFGVPVHFYAIDKTSMLLGIFKPTDTFLESGERKVEKAVNIYRQFFSEDAEISIDDFYFDELLN